MGDCVAGLDPSLNGFGLCVWPRDAKTPELHRLAARPRGNSLSARMERITELLTKVFDVLDVWQPGVVVLEHYSFGSIQGVEGLQRGHFDRAELGGVLRLQLWALDYVHEAYEVAPASLKAFVLKGNASKAEVVNRIFAEHGLNCATTDEADAAACALIARCVAGWDKPDEERQRVTLSKLAG